MPEKTKKTMYIIFAD